MRGLFIAFEGCDKSGKTTQSILLNKNLPNSCVQRFPDRTTHVGSILNSFLKLNIDLNRHSVHLLFSANRWEVASRITKMLNEGINVIVDRYAYSGVACSMANNVTFEWAIQADRGLPRPDIVFLLDASIETIRKRGDYGSERFEDDCFQEKVAHIFNTCLFDATYWVRVDANRDDMIVSQYVMNMLQNVTITSDIRSLW